MDLAREGAVPYLVALMGPEAQEAEQLHAARLTAILAQVRAVFPGCWDATSRACIVRPVFVGCWDAMLRAYA